MRMFRHLIAAAVAACAVVSVAAPVSAVPDEGTAGQGDVRADPISRVEYQLGTRDARIDLENAATIVAHTLNDPRGWSLDGRVAFVEVERTTQLRIWFASPDVVAAAAPGCSARYSCRVGNDVYLNAVRWQRGAATYRSRPLGDYRQYVVNHEVGHWIGLAHRGCRDSGSPAPVMQQQTITLDGCDSSVWPSPSERARARRLTL